MPLSTAQGSDCLQYLKTHYNATLPELVAVGLSLTNDPIGALTEILHTFLDHERWGKAAKGCILQVTKEHFSDQLSILASKSSGWHLSALKAESHKIEDLDLETMLGDMQRIAPDLCTFIQEMMSADKKLIARRIELAAARARKAAGQRRKLSRQGEQGEAAYHGAVDEEGGDEDEDEEMWSLFPNLEDIDPDEEQYWSRDFEPHMPEDPSDNGSAHDEDRARERRDSLTKIKTVICLSIMMQSTNQRCNALQTSIGLFLHACSAPEEVTEFLAHTELSISSSAVNDAVTNLSKESARTRRKTGQTLCTAYAVDNVDIELKHLVPTVENPDEALVHLTSGTMLPLQHGVHPSDLKCSEELWRKTKDRMSDTGTYLVNPDFSQLLDIHPEQEDHPSGMTRRDRFNAWVFLQTLVLHGPEYFQRFRQELGEPEVIESIPLVKTEQVPVEAMDINPSTASGNGDVIVNVLRQGGVGDPEQENAPRGIKNIDDHVVIVHGDLGTGERIESLQASRSEERTPWLRFQFVVFVLGLFHLKMACADAIWRIFIQPLKARKDTYSLLEHVAILRPKETGKISTKPGFRRMHEVIQHVGIVTRLEGWRKTVKNGHYNCASLEEFAQTKPTWEILTRIANRLALREVADVEFSKTRRLPPELRDKVHENYLLRQQYFLLYEELSYAMNAGDIGRVEECFMPWVFIFRGCGKHKYASHMMRYLYNIHFVYPERLRRAIRMNILCNPTGRKGHFRAIDWLVEHNNLFIKRIFGGKFANHLKAYILKESALLGVYKSIREQFRRMFCLNHKSYRHSPPLMKRTFEVLRRWMEREQVVEMVPGRDVKYSIPDVWVTGMNILQSATPIGVGAVEGGNEGNIEDDVDIDVDEDDEVEVEDDGDLEI